MMKKQFTEDHWRNEYLPKYPNRYLLDKNGEPYQCFDMERHTQWFIEALGVPLPAGHGVAITRIRNVILSTTFLGVDAGKDCGADTTKLDYKPIVWRTVARLVDGNENEGTAALFSGNLRYAQTKHFELVRELRKGI